MPIGAVLVREGRILARAGNRTIRDCDPTAHAEIVALREAARLLGNYRLADTTLYVTIEPCSMCAGAMIQARVPRLVYGADEPRGGAVQSCFEVLSHPDLNHRVEISLAGILAVIRLLADGRFNTNFCCAAGMIICVVSAAAGSRGAIAGNRRALLR